MAKCLKLLLLLACISCSRSSDKPPPYTEQSINGRDEIVSYGHTVRRPVYHAKVPLTWERLDPSENESLLDTTKPIVTFVLDKGLLINVHSFPSDSLEERITPAAQIEHWRSLLKGETYRLDKIGHGGFSGLYLEGKNLSAWSLQLDAQNYQILHYLATTVEEEEHYKQMAADYTIKAIGPNELLEKHRDEISLFINSFELIQEIPCR